MDFIDYYAVLDLPQTARIRDVQKAFDKLCEESIDPELVEVVAEAYATLINPYKRKRYDRIMGYLICIQMTPLEYKNALCFQINSVQPYASLYNLIPKFKSWIQSRYDLDWEEADQAGYSYHLENNGDYSYLLF